MFCQQNAYGFQRDVFADLEFSKGIGYLTVGTYFLDKGSMKTILNYETPAADAKALTDVRMTGCPGPKESIKQTPYLINLWGVSEPRV